MRCIACGENMILIKSVPDITKMVPGYERQTLQCCGCGESEHRLIFNPVRSPAATETWERMNRQFRQRQATPHCLDCGEEMTLVETVPDHNMMVAGYEHQTYRCAACGACESRFVFKRPAQGTKLTRGGSDTG
jgi:hypothetical protein